ncbi:MAG TPA: AraC family transcriptional regulator [Pedobacter sp.]
MRFTTDKNPPQLRYACYTQKTRAEETFIREHVLTHILSGSLTIHTVSKNYNFVAGDTVLFKRNLLAKVTQLPAPAEDFKSVSVYFEQSVLKNFSTENKISPSIPYTGDPVLKLENSSLYESYTSSLHAYQQGSANDGLTALKVKEALMLIMHLDQGTAAMLFDFSEPLKADLAEYMNTYFRFNIRINHFAYLTGRSTATFKRDFAKIFPLSPNKWLQQKRLKEAYELIRRKRMKASHVYLEVGFEDLSHFSFAFKKAFGKAPSLI